MENNKNNNEPLNESFDDNLDELDVSEVDISSDAETDDVSEAPDSTDKSEEDIDYMLDILEARIIHSDNNYDSDMWIEEEPVKKNEAGLKTVRSIYDFVETLAIVTIAIVLCFSFFFRLNIVSGTSMNNTLAHGEYLFVSDVMYTPKAGDIVVVHDLTLEGYPDPIVKRVIATEGQTVDIDYETWTLTVDGKVIDESEYRYLDPLKNDDRYLRETYMGVNENVLEFPVTVEPGHVFVLGDNRRNSADSRVTAIGQIDVRCIVGKVYARVLPFSNFTVFKNPFEE